MTPAAAAILEGMPDPRLLHRADGDGTTWILAGSVVLACYPSGDAGLRNVTVAVCRQLGFGGRAVAAVMGLTENYVATLHNRALREGTAGLVQAQGRPRKLAGNAWEKAARWRAEGASDSEIARRLGVAQSTVFRRLGPAAVQEQLPGGGPEDEPAAPGPQAGGVPLIFRTADPYRIVSRKDGIKCQGNIRRIRRSSAMRRPGWSWRRRGLSPMSRGSLRSARPAWGTGCGRTGKSMRKTSRRCSYPSGRGCASWNEKSASSG
jgi:hypothetical protein